MSTSRPDGSGDLSPRGFRTFAILIVAFALGVRALYLLMTVTPYPIRGDINQYALYAWNLSHRSTFSTALPNSPEAVPDSYRGPGYALLLAATMVASGGADLPMRPGPEGSVVLGYDTDRWMRLAFAIQAMLGAATVALAIAVARSWLSRRWALVSGLLIALWPHLISFTGILLSETLFGFLLLLSLWLVSRATESRSRMKMAFAGLCWGATYLVNPVVALFPVIAGGILLRRAQASLAVVLIAGFLMAPGAWALRNATVPAGAGSLLRIEQNFVQGSWPQFHRAYNSRFDNAISQQIIAAIDAEVSAFQDSPRQALNNMVERMALDPAFYLTWYALEKPYLLWDWGIRVGAGDIYFLPTQHSMFERIPILAATKHALQWLNPWLFALAAGTALVVAFAAVRRRRAIDVALVMTSSLCLYLTAVHVVLQAEPRYSIPYRPEEVLLAMTALSWAVETARRVRAKKVAPAGLPHIGPSDGGALEQQVDS